MNVNDCNLEDAWGRLDGLYSTCSKKEKEKWCLCYVQQNNLLKILLHLVRSLPVPFNTTKCEIIFNGTTASLELLHDFFQLNKLIDSLSTRKWVKRIGRPITSKYILFCNMYIQWEYIWKLVMCSIYRLCGIYHRVTQTCETGAVNYWYGMRFDSFTIHPVGFIWISCSILKLPIEISNGKTK